MRPELIIYCICAGFGFPVGTASTKRIMLLGRALHSVGVPFHVWHIGTSSYPQNVDRKGEQGGISWEYLSPVVRRPDNCWLRALCFIWGFSLLPFKLAKHRQYICVYLYSQGDLINLGVLIVCRMLRIPVAQECCEWWPGTPDEKPFRRWMYHRIMFRWSRGALPISKLIEERIHNLARIDYPTLKVPVLVDVDEVHQERNHPPTTPETDKPYLFWCGMVDGYKRDPLFLIRVLGEMKRLYSLSPLLVLAGPCSVKVNEELLAAASKAGLSQTQISITGFISEAELFRLATHAAVALLPLWDDDRSNSRFPTKLGLYAAAGRPLVTSPIGEILHYLQDKETALFAPAGDECIWAEVIASVMVNPELSSTLVEHMQAYVLPQFEYRNLGPALKDWFGKLHNQN